MALKGVRARPGPRRELDVMSREGETDVQPWLYRIRCVRLSLVVGRGSLCVALVDRSFHGDPRPCFGTRCVSCRVYRARGVRAPQDLLLCSLWLCSASVVLSVSAGCMPLFVFFYVDQGPRAHFHTLLCRSSWLMQRSATTTHSPRMPYPASQVLLFQLVMSAARLVIVGDPVRCIAAVRPYMA